MKAWKKYLLSLLLVPASFAVLSVAKFVYAMPSDTFMSFSEAKKRWGEDPFDAELFKNGDESARAKMALSIVKNPTVFIGKTAPELRQMLGSQTGYYRFDMNPAYLISRDEEGEDTWQLLFLLDRNYKIKTVKIHKN